MTIWNVQGTDNQRRIVEDTLARVTFDFDALVPGLRAQTGRTTIPVEWADLSRYMKAAEAATEQRGESGPVAVEDTPDTHVHFNGEVHADHVYQPSDEREDAPRAAGDGHDHDHAEPGGTTDHSTGASDPHIHVTGPDGDVGHPISREIDGRMRVLGLAWYSGKVSLDLTLERDPELAAEVFLSEGAHMVDFFALTNEHRVAIWNALHAGTSQDIPPGTAVTDGTPLGHGHGWFDVAGYYAWIGEAFMGLFVKAYSDVPVTIRFDHPPTPEAVHEAHHALTPYFGVDDSEVFHDHHRGIDADIYWMTPPENRRPCATCKPRG